MTVEKVKPDPLNLTVNTVVGKRDHNMIYKCLASSPGIFCFYRMRLPTIRSYLKIYEGANL